MGRLRGIIPAATMTVVTCGAAAAATRNDHMALAGPHVAQAPFLVNVRSRSRSNI